MQYRCTVSSTDGPQQNAKPGCPRGHWINAPIEALTLDKPQHGPARHDTAGHQQARRPATPCARGAIQSGHRRLYHPAGPAGSTAPERIAGQLAGGRYPDMSVTFTARQ